MHERNRRHVEVPGVQWCAARLCWSSRYDPGDTNADVAQLVAHHLPAKVRVAGSNPVVRSRGHGASGGVAEARQRACKAVYTVRIPSPPRFTNGRLARW